MITVPALGDVADADRNPARALWRDQRESGSRGTKVIRSRQGDRASSPSPSGSAAQCPTATSRVATRFASAALTALLTTPIRSA